MPGRCILAAGHPCRSAFFFLVSGFMAVLIQCVQQEQCFCPLPVCDFRCACHVVVEPLFACHRLTGRFVVWWLVLAAVARVGLTSPLPASLVTAGVRPRPRPRRVRGLYAEARGPWTNDRRLLSVTALGSPARLVR